MELIGQEIAKRSAAIADEEAKAKSDPAKLSALNEDRSALRQRQEALRANDAEGIEAVFAEFGRGRG